MCRFQVVLSFCIAAFLLVFSLAGCGKPAAGPSAASSIAAGQGTPAAAAANDPSQSGDPLVVVHTTQGDITFQLYADKAPRTVENFLRGYVERGFYEQTIFHHVEPGKMLIGGGYTSQLERKPPRAPIYNESRNGLLNRKGTIAMIREPESPHSATSEFFVNLADNADFDYRTTDTDDEPGYCVFGEIVSGMDVVNRIAQLPTAAQGDFPNVPSPTVAITGVQRLR